MAELPGSPEHCLLVPQMHTGSLAGSVNHLAIPQTRQPLSLPTPQLPRAPACRGAGSLCRVQWQLFYNIRPSAACDPGLGSWPLRRATLGTWPGLEAQVLEGSWKLGVRTVLGGAFSWFQVCGWLPKGGGAKASPSPSRLPSWSPGHALWQLPAQSDPLFWPRNCRPGEASSPPKPCGPRLRGRLSPVRLQGAASRGVGDTGM